MKETLNFARKIILRLCFTSSLRKIFELLRLNWQKLFYITNKNDWQIHPKQFFLTAKSKKKKKSLKNIKKNLQLKILVMKRT